MGKTYDEIAFKNSPERHKHKSSSDDMSRGVVRSISSLTPQDVERPEYCIHDGVFTQASYFAVS